MALHPDHDSSDETDGKYSIDEKMTFESVLKTSLRERKDHQKKLDELVETDRGATPPERKAEVRRAKHQEGAERQREENASREREALATRIGEKHVSNHPSYRLANGETPRIGLHTTYELARTIIDDKTYYYVVQLTEQSYERHEGKLVVKDFGTEWDYTVPEINVDVLRRAIKQQRKEDLRAGRKPVAQLTVDQGEAVEEWYNEWVENKLSGLEDVPQQKEDDVYVFDRYLIVDADEVTLQFGHLQRTLSNKQAEVMGETLLRLVKANTDLPLALYDHLRDSVDYPLLAQITFNTE